MNERDKTAPKSAMSYLDYDVRPMDRSKLNLALPYNRREGTGSYAGRRTFCRQGTPFVGPGASARISPERLLPISNPATQRTEISIRTQADL